MYYFLDVFQLIDFIDLSLVLKRLVIFSVVRVLKFSINICDPVFSIISLAKLICVIAISMFSERTAILFGDSYYYLQSNDRHLIPIPLYLLHICFVCGSDNIYSIPFFIIAYFSL